VTVDAETRSRAVREALGARLEEVRARGGDPASAMLPGGPPLTAEEAEELLRLVMVRLWPAARAPRAGAAEAERLVESVLQLRVAARREDLRFLDAWNNAYEALAARPELLAGPVGKRLLDSYAAVLEVRVHRPV
jgi:hypothetical protein